MVFINLKQSQYIRNEEICITGIDSVATWCLPLAFVHRPLESMVLHTKVILYLLHVMNDHSYFSSLNLVVAKKSHKA